MHIIGIAGHIDHGKTTLVKRLTGMETDNLLIEKQRGMSIELGFAHYKNASDEQISIIDVPGHEKFIQNMIAGMHSIDLAILVVAAGEGVMPQTIEHLDIIKLLNIENILIAITKCDLFPNKQDINKIENDVSSLMKSKNLINQKNNLQIIKIDDTQKSIDTLKTVIEQNIFQHKKKFLQDNPRLFVDRSFTLKGFGTVVTGTLTNGSFSVGESITILPEKKLAKIRNMQVSGNDVKKASANSRLAINLQGVTKDEIHRGNVIRPIQNDFITTQFDASINNITEKKIVTNKKIIIHIGTAHSEARIKLIGADELNKNIKAFCQIQLFQPISVNQFDHFIIRFSGKTIGGGEVLRTTTYKYNRFDENEIYRLSEISKRNIDEIILSTTTDQRLIHEDDLYHSINLEPSEIKQKVNNLIHANKIIHYKIKENNYYIASETIEKLNKQVTSYMKNYFTKNKLKRSIQFNQLKQRLNIEEHLLHCVIKQAKVIDSHNNNEFFLTNFKNQLTKKQTILLEQTMQQIKSFNLAPIKINITKELHEMLLVEKEIMNIEKNLYLHEESYQHAKKEIVNFLKKNPRITLAQIRDFLSINRKVAQFILEKMDDEQITIRKNEYRVLVK
tara:strand:- start:37295 stop:39148 length:1854 start_codon:yes stop_codon:yes gene_type:complete